MDLLHVLKEWMPLLSPVVFLVIWPLLHFAVNRTLATKDDLTRAEETTRAEFRLLRSDEARAQEQLGERLHEMGERLHQVEVRVARLETGGDDNASKADVAGLQQSIASLQVSVKQIQDFLLDRVRT